MEGAEVVGIFIGPRVGGPMEAVEGVRAIPGRGLEGDRHERQARARPSEASPGREVTLIESEALEALRDDHGIALGPGESRRNLVTRGVGLNGLVDREFRVGPVLLRGIEPCHPCRHLEKLTQKGVMRGLKSRGGLRAQVLSGGEIRVGDPVEAPGPP